ncbi:MULTISPECIES: twin-arginine translocase subunit TatC [unclassified Streptomyces]|uniref:twin-arginine translocase subunit TatC n=1 Tax=unclassified Streptomyces TaxID=2593676 RepID=UPI002254F70F|nr:MULTISPECIES: twin-arginine translocase subunit TatC [unclassified Streptomyces]MCX4524961.1 twin-arginine translocase subunit TatC [Streptomyces sp. NBC_01551]MCX4544527.1 twin-arginine translocase subunit TatC [Streptomyces sp. NBC_01565]
MLKSARKQGKQDQQAKDAEGRMPLVEHLRELRNRLLKSVLAIIVITAVAVYYYRPIIDFLLEPMLSSVGCGNGATYQRNGQPCAQMTTSGLTAPFSIALKVGLSAGVVLSAPVWLYQLWAFAAPGLHKSEKKYALSFVAVGAPLFLAGAVLAYKILPQTAEILLGLTPDHVQNLLPVDDYLDLVTRMVVVFGLAFELPLILVLLNFTGVLSAKRLGSWWRAMVLGITLFSAFATPTGDPLTMLTLASPIVALYFMALGICLLNDRRRGRNNPDALLDDDEASQLDLTPAPIGAVESVPAPKALPEQADGGSRRINGYDDAT